MVENKLAQDAIVIWLCILDKIGYVYMNPSGTMKIKKKKKSLLDKNQYKPNRSTHTLSWL